MYGLIGLGAGAAYSLLVRMIIRTDGPDSLVGRSIGTDRKGYVSLVLYVVGAGLAHYSSWLSYAAYASVAVLWFIPDRRLSRSPRPS